MTPSQRKGLAWLAAASGFAAFFAVGLPGLAARVPWSVERRLGAVLNARRRACEEPRGEAALAAVVARLYPRMPGDEALPVSVAVVPGREVNAFAALGGSVYVYDGLVQQARSPEELAGVLAHELEHVRRRHVVQALASKLLTTGLLRLLVSPRAAYGGALLELSFSREQERQADEGALLRLRAARVDTAGFAAFFERAERQSSVPALLSDHPASASRAELARRYAGGPSDPLLSEEQWRALKAVCR